MPEKVDLKTALDAYQGKRGMFRLLEVPAMQYLMVDGQGDPNTSAEFRAAIETLYPVAYAMKFASKFALNRDYVVMPLEGRWWADDMTTFTSARDKNRWRWTLMIMTPEWLGAEMFDAAVEKVRAKGAPRLDELRLQTLSEGLSVQTLHVGSFDSEAETLERMHSEFIPQHGLRLTGHHHEIYLTDFRRGAPEKQRTLLRQPVARVG